MTADRLQPGPFSEEVLLLAPGGGEASELRAGLAEPGLHVRACHDVDELCRRMRAGGGVALIAADSLRPASAGVLADALSEPARRFDSAAIVLVEEGRLAGDRGHPLASLENAILVPRTLPGAFLQSVLRFVLWRRFELRRLRLQLVERERHAKAARGSEEQIKQQKETLEQLVSQRTAEADRRAEQLRALATQLTQAEQRERRRLAQVLHDQLQQLLVASRLKLGALRGRVPVQELKDAFGQLDDVLKQALEASRSLTTELSPPILYDAGLAAALEWLARQTRHKHGLIVDVRTDRDAEPVDEELRILLFQAVRELLFNVVKHAGTDRARVTMSPAQADRVRIVVADAGVGFDPDRRGLAQFSDGGFGLFSMRERLESIDGSLAVESSPGRGTRVTIVAPRCQLPTPADVQITHASAAKEPGPSAQPLKTIRVLLADDHDMVREGLASILSDESDIELVGEASDGQEAVDLALRTRPDVVVMDIAMPRLNGIEATRRIVAELPEARVIGLSMHEREDMEAAMRKAGAAAYLPKGDTTDTLIDAIRRAAAAKPAG